MSDTIHVPEAKTSTDPGWWLWNGFVIRVNCPRCSAHEILYWTFPSHYAADGSIEVTCPKCELSGCFVLEGLAARLPSLLKYQKEYTAKNNLTWPSKSVQSEPK